METKTTELLSERPSTFSTVITLLAVGFCLSTSFSLWEGLKNPLDANADAASANELSRL